MWNFFKKQKPELTTLIKADNTINKEYVAIFGQQVVLYKDYKKLLQRVKKLEAKVK